MTSNVKKPYIIVIFQGGVSPDPMPPSGSAHGLEYAMPLCSKTVYQERY